MPANLPPQYLKVEDEYRNAQTAEQRLEKLREMFRLLPKHKGTERLQSDLKQKISQLKDEQARGKAQGKKGGISYHVPREGAGQLMLIGPPNAGKSSLLAALTSARPEIAPYPFTTRLPQPGIMMWQDVPVQLVDLPAISAEFVEPWVPNVIRSGDAAVLVADLASDEVADASQAVLDRLAAKSHRAGWRASLRQRGRVDAALENGDGGQQGRLATERASGWRFFASGSSRGFRSSPFRQQPERGWNRCAQLHTIYWV